MALLWHKQQGDERYEVRSAGSSCRLYRNGVFHSQFNESRELAGGVWDLLMLPALFCLPGTIQRVLVLGVGGGAVIRQLQRYLPAVQIVGVDLDAIHLELAERFFGVGGDNVALHCADARDWLRDYQGEGFDLILDDLFFEQQGEPMRAVAVDQSWLMQLQLHLNPGGTLAFNFAEREQLEESALPERADGSELFQSGFALTTKGYHNTIATLMADSLTPRQLRERVKPLFRTPPDYTIRTLFNG